MVVFATRPGFGLRRFLVAAFQPVLSRKRVKPGAHPKGSFPVCDLFYALSPGEFCQHAGLVRLLSVVLYFRRWSMDRDDPILDGQCHLHDDDSYDRQLYRIEINQSFGA